MKSTLLIAACVVALLMVNPARSQDQSNAKRPGSQQRLQELLKERATTAQELFHAATDSFEAQTITLFDYVTSLKALERAEVALAPQTEIAARERSVERFKDLEKRIAELHQHGLKGAEKKEMAFITLSRQSAEIGLLEAKLAIKP